MEIREREKRVGRETEPIIISRAGSALTPLHPTASREEGKKQKKRRRGAIGSLGGALWEGGAVPDDG